MKNLKSRAFRFVIPINHPSKHSEPAPGLLFRSAEYFTAKEKLPL